MEPRKLNGWNEWLESDRLIATAFLHKWNEKEAAERFEAQEKGEKPRYEEAWGVYDDSGKMVSTIVTRRGKRVFGGKAVDVGDVSMVGSLPEARGGGNVRALMKAVLTDFRARGDLFATLFPFSFSFYRKFGFELGQRTMRQSAPIDQFKGFHCDRSVKQVYSQEDADVVRALYERFIMDHDIAEMRNDRDWNYRGNGEYGEPNWWFGDAQRYTYVFSDTEGTPDAYLRFRFREGKEGPMTGTMEIEEMVYNRPESFRSVLGFIYGMRAKVVDVSVELMDRLDLSTILPECGKVKRELDGHLMVRILDAERALREMRYPAGNGRFTIKVEDAFLPDNSGVYSVEYSDGKAIKVIPGGGEADLDVTVETLTQLMVGLITVTGAEFREGTTLRSNRDTFESVFRG